MTQKCNGSQYLSMILLTSIAIVGILFPGGCRCMKCAGDLLHYTDIGIVSHAGSSEYFPENREFVVSGGGDNIWGTEDAFHYLWRQSSGDWSMKTKVRWKGAGKNAHRKAGWMIRQELTADSVYVDAVVHGDGLASMQFRKEKGGQTQEIQSNLKAPAYLWLQRKGQVCTFSVSADGIIYHTVGSVDVSFSDPVYMGLAVCSHDDTTLETAVFSDIEIISLHAGQRD